MTHTPIRTCVGCRGTADQSVLLRVVRVGAAPVTVMPDPPRRLPGRGAYVHLEPGCVLAAERRRAFARALRVAGPVDALPVRQYVESIAVGYGEPRSE